MQGLHSFNHLASGGLVTGLKVLKVTEWWPCLWNKEYVTKWLAASILVGVLVLLKGIVMYTPWGGTRTLPQGHTIFKLFLLLLLYFCICSLPCLKLRESQGGCIKPISYKQETGDTERIYIQEKHRILLHFNMSYYAHFNCLKISILSA